MQYVASIAGGLVGLALGFALWGSDDAPATRPPQVQPSDAAPAVAEPADPPPAIPEKRAAPRGQREEASGDNQALRQEVRALKQQVARLEASLSEARKQRARDDAATGAGAAKPEPLTQGSFNAAFEKLEQTGLKAYNGADYRALAERLKALGPEGMALLAPIFGGDGDATARFLAAALAAEAGDAAAVPMLAKALGSDDDLVVRRMASHGLATMKNEDGLAALKAAMVGDKDWGVRVNAAYGAAKLGDAEGLALLEKAYFSPDTPTEYLMGILGGLADVAAPSTAPTFLRILKDTKDPGYLIIAIDALAKMKDTRTIPALKTILASDLPESVRAAAEKALENQ